MFKFKLITAFCILSALAACGGTSVPIEMAEMEEMEEDDQDPGMKDPVDPMAAFNARVTRVNQIPTELQQYQGTSAGLLNLAEIRQIGGGTYAGPFIMATRDSASERGFFGDGTMTVTLGTEPTITGGVTNITHTDRGIPRAATPDIPAGAVFTPITGSLEFTGITLGEGDNIGFASIPVEGRITLPPNLNDKPGSVDVLLGGQIALGLFTDQDDFFGSTGLIARRLDDDRLSIQEALFFGEKQ